MDDLNKGLFTFAAYNAGPGRIRQLRRIAEKRGLDPNVWFGNVERIASERIGRETVTYVSNIYKVLRGLPADYRGNRAAPGRQRVGRDRRPARRHQGGDGCQADDERHADRCQAGKQQVEEQRPYQADRAFAA